MEDNKIPGTPTGERMYSKTEVENLMRKRVGRSHKSFFDRYGVKDLNELDDLFEKTTDYDNMKHEYESMKDEFSKIQLNNSDLKRDNAFLKNKINPDRYEDIKAYFKGRDLEFSEDSLIEAMGTHPEWKIAETPVATIETLGSEAHVNPEIDERAQASKIFGVDL